MYLDYFGLEEAPFSIAPDPRYLFMSERHREALAHLLYGVNGDGGFVVLTGEVGTGKTTICRFFLNQVPKTTDVAFIVNPKLSAKELLASICDEFGLETGPDPSIKALNDALNTYLLAAHSEGKQSVLIIDEAQNLQVDVLEQLRLLTNLETAEKKLLQIILLGQPELRMLLAQQELRQLNQRVTARYHLHELTRPELGIYVTCRLAVAGCRTRLFSNKALNKLYKYSGGVPRLINLLAGRALLGAYASHSESVEVEHVKQAHVEIQGEFFGKKPIFAVYGVWATSAVLAGALFISLGVWSTSWLDSVGPDLTQEYEQQPQGIDNPTEIVQLSASRGIPEAPIVDASKVESSLDQNRDMQKSESPIIEDFQEALSSTPESLAAYAEAPTPDTKLLKAPTQEFDEQLSSVAEFDSLADREKHVKGKFMGYQSLFDVWGLNYSPEPFLLACQFAEINGLRCLHKNGNWRSLISIDRPALLTLFNGRGEKIFLSLIKIDDQRALVSHAGDIFWTSLDEIDRHWLGEYSVVWKLPPYKSNVIEPGQLLEEDWLNTGLTKINGLSGHQDQLIRPTIDLKQMIVDFQKQMGLVPDGVAGSLTLIQMNSLLGVGSPSLLGKS
jgi:general secretion pathway protein A